MSACSSPLCGLQSCLGCGRPLACERRAVVSCCRCRTVQFLRNNSCVKCRQPLSVPIDELEAPPSASLPVMRTRSGAPTVVDALPSMIRLARAVCGLSQKGLIARMAAANADGPRARTWISKVENEIATPSVASLERIARGLGTSTRMLVTLCEVACEAQFQPLWANGLAEFPAIDRDEWALSA